MLPATYPDIINYMAQRIQIIKVGERGDCLEELHSNFETLFNKLLTVTNYNLDFPWLSTIDPYGDTTFNRLQIPILIDELDKLHKVILMSDFSEQIEQLIKYLQQVSVHQYIKFIGD